jgi:broad specificity phosphatase PhoE
MSSRFFLVRHALVEPAARTIIYGNADVPLCPEALLAEASAFRWLAQRLPAPASWVVTPLQRTAATAAAIFAAGHPAAPLTVEPALMEQGLGALQGLTHTAFAARITLPPHPFWPHAAEEKPPGGESFAEVIDRVGPTLEALADAHPDGDIVIVAHGGSIRAAIAHAMGLAPSQALAFSIKNLSLTRLERHGADWRVAAVNEEPFWPMDVE